MLDRGLPYQSGPQWLAEHVLQGRHVFAVCGHSRKDDDRESAGMDSRRCGARTRVPDRRRARQFRHVLPDSARASFSSVEADEYDTAFFDKRAKFVHYRPRTLILNNLEFDHADIYKDLDAINWQFHQLMRTVPQAGRVLRNAGDENISKMLEMGCWTPVESFGLGDDSDWRASFGDAAERDVRISGPGRRRGYALDARRTPQPRKCAGGRRCSKVCRRRYGPRGRCLVPLRGPSSDAWSARPTVSDIAIYDDFAHHPTAIRRTINAVRRRYPGQRVVVAIEPRSNTMKLGVHNDDLADSLKDADLVWMFRPEGMGEHFEAALGPLGSKLLMFNDYDKLVNDMSTKMLAGDQVIFMSNGGFGNARQTLTAVLQRTRSS